MRKAVLLVLALAVLAAAGFLVRGFSHASLEPYAAIRTLHASPGGLQARFFGTTTIAIDDGATRIMIDGFFSRPGMLRSMFGKVAPDAQRIDRALEQGEVTHAAAVLVAHSHFDHAMDCAAVADRTGAVVVGSQSTANIARGHGLAEDRIRVVKGGETLEFGGFTVQVFSSPHSPDLMFPGEITAPLRPPVRGSAYREGGSYSFLLRHTRGNVLIHPSANVTPGLYRGVRADVVFLGIGRLGKQSEEFQARYWQEVVRTTGAKVVIPIHWDDFTSSLDEPLQPMPRLLGDFDADMEQLRARAQADGVTVVLPLAFEPMTLPVGLTRE